MNAPPSNKRSSRIACLTIDHLVRTVFSRNLTVRCLSYLFVTRPREESIGLLVTGTAKALSRAFDEALANAGGSLPTWLVLVSLKRRAWGTQGELAQALG